MLDSSLAWFAWQLFHEHHSHVVRGSKTDHTLFVVSFYTARYVAVLWSSDQRRNANRTHLLSQHHPHQAQQGPPLPPHLQHPRSSHPNSPHQHPGAFPSPHSSVHSQNIPHHTTYPPPGPSPNAHPPSDVTYYSHPTPYGTPAPGSFSGAGKTLASDACRDNYQMLELSS